MSGVFRLRDRVFSGGTHVMGILNVTPDSFFAPSRVGGGFAERALKMLKDGAELIDVGGQSTRPASTPVSVIEELSRVIPAVEEIRASSDCLISVDTFYPEVAEEALAAGADMINDVSGLADVALAEAVAKYGAGICIMHNRRQSTVPDLMTDKQTGLALAADRALRAGVREDGILLDGGIGFNKSADEDRYLLKHYAELSLAGYPLLLGTSRKSFFGGDVSERLTATMETSVFAAKSGIMFVRVHDVRENKLAIDSVTGGGR